MTPLDEPPNPGWVSIEIYDPTTRTSFHLQPATKTASNSQFPFPGEKPQHVCKDSDFSAIDPKAVEPLVAEQVSQGELAHDVVDGLGVRHGRETVKSKSGAYSTLTDYWFSQALQFFVLVKRKGPGRSRHIVKLFDISRVEPDPSLFVIPTDYHVFPSLTCGPEIAPQSLCCEHLACEHLFTQPTWP